MLQKSRLSDLDICKNFLVFKENFTYVCKKINTGPIPFAGWKTRGIVTWNRTDIANDTPAEAEAITFFLEYHN